MPYHIKKGSVLGSAVPTDGQEYYAGDNHWTNDYSKRKIYEEMVIFFESSIFPRIESMKQNHANDEIPGLIVTLILTFLETNKGFAKIINKQALTAAEAKIDDKISLILEKLNVEIKQSFQSYERETKKKLALNSTNSSDLLMACMEGQIQAFIRSNFKKNPVSSWQEHWQLLRKIIFV